MRFTDKVIAVTGAGGDWVSRRTGVWTEGAKVAVVDHNPGKQPPEVRQCR
jgi:hypothetical protein